MGLYDNLTYESGEMLGFSQSTLIVLGAILVISVILRLIVSNLSHGFFGVIVRNDTIRQKTVKKGDKALGSVGAYAFSFVTIDLLVREQADNENILMVLGRIHPGCSPIPTGHFDRRMGLPSGKPGLRCRSIPRQGRRTRWN